MSMVCRSRGRGGLVCRGFWPTGQRLEAHRRILSPSFSCRGNHEPLDDISAWGGGDGLKGEDRA